MSACLLLFWLKVYLEKKNIWKDGSEWVSVDRHPQNDVLCPIWSFMENNSYSPVLLFSLLCAPLPLSKCHLTNNPITYGSLKIWSQFFPRIYFKHKHAPIISPILANVILLHLSQTIIFDYAIGEVSAVWSTYLKTGTSTFPCQVSLDICR